MTSIYLISNNKDIVIPNAIEQECNHRGIYFTEDDFGTHPGKVLTQMCRQIFNDPRGAAEGLHVSKEMWYETSDPEFVEWLKALGALPARYTKKQVALVEKPLAEAVLGILTHHNGPVTDVKYLQVEYSRPVMLEAYGKILTPKQRRKVENQGGRKLFRV